jgi:hypothetical protein
LAVDERTGLDGKTRSVRISPARSLNLGDRRIDNARGFHLRIRNDAGGLYLCFVKVLRADAGGHFHVGRVMKDSASLVVV